MDLTAPFGLLGKPSPAHQGCLQSRSVASHFRIIYGEHTASTSSKLSKYFCNQKTWIFSGYDTFEFKQV